VTTDIARAIIDMNRAEDDRRKDGVVKTHTCWDVSIYSESLPDSVVENLIKKYHRPYHNNLRNLAENVMAGIDCHTMAAVGPPVGPDSGKKRPPVCLSNGDGTCPKEWFISLAEIIEKAFGMPVALNNPFKGGYIIRHHAREIPWIQIEMSRAPFLSNREKGLRLLEALQKWIAGFDFRK
jgi:N-formylglutamate amidohydrolase